MNVRANLDGLVLSFESVGPVRISGNLNGSTLRGAGPSAPANAAKAVALASVSVLGNARGALILTGFDATGLLVNADAATPHRCLRELGTESQVAGANPGADVIFGTEDDRLISGPNSDSIIPRRLSFGLFGDVIVREVAPSI